MKRLMTVVALTIMIAALAPPADAFFDYLFSGSASRGAIGNSALGDLRSWWTGNPVYVFNPLYSGPTQPYPPQGPQPAAQPNPYGYGGGARPAPAPAPTPQQYGQPYVNYVGPQPAAPNYRAQAAPPPGYGPPQQYAPQPQAPVPGYGGQPVPQTHYQQAPMQAPAYGPR
jgi:hypothetical protein